MSEWEPFRSLLAWVPKNVLGGTGNVAYESLKKAEEVSPLHEARPIFVDIPIKEEKELDK